MKLIDADKLLYAVQGAIDVMDAHGMDTVGATSLKAIIKCVPAVDAIPVEWLREMMHKPQMTCGNPFGFVLTEWLEEQEAR